MNRFLIGVVALLVLIVLAAGAWLLLREDEDETYEVSRGSIDVTIQTIGKVQSSESTAIRSRAAGEVEIVAVEPGDRVAEGDIVVQLATEPFERAIRDAQQQLEEAEFVLQQAQSLADQEPEDQANGFAVVQAAQLVDAAEEALDEAFDALVDAYIRAPRDGVILEVPVEIDTVVNRGTPVVIMFEESNLEVIANVDELDLVNVEIGAEARLRLDAFPDRELTGTVVATAPAATVQGGATIFPTTIALDVPDNLDIRPGMNADVTIVTEAREDVLLIPQQYIRTVGNRAFVQALIDGEEVEREVNLGYRSDGEAEVVSGLEEGDVIVLP